MAVRVLDGAVPSHLERLVDDYLAHCAARGLSQRTLTNSYGYALHDVFLPWCSSQGLGDVSQTLVRSGENFCPNFCPSELIAGDLS